MQILRYRQAVMMLEKDESPKLYHCYRLLIGLKRFTMLLGLNPIQASLFKETIQVELIEDKTERRIKKNVDFSKIDFKQSIQVYAKIKKPTTERKGRIAPNVQGK